MILFPQHASLAKTKGEKKKKRLEQQSVFPWDLKVAAFLKMAQHYPVFEALSATSFWGRGAVAEPEFGRSKCSVRLNFSMMFLIGIGAPS